MPTSNAVLIMNRMEGYLAKNMASFRYVSNFAIQAEVRSIFLTVSRLDLTDGVSEIEVYCSPLPNKRYNIAGVGSASAAAVLATSDHKNKEGLALFALLAGAIAEYSEKKEQEERVKKDLAYGLFLARITVKFSITGAFFPAATLEGLIEDNTRLIELNESDLPNFKRIESYKAQGVNAGPPTMVNLALLAKSNGATHDYFVYQKQDLVRYAFYKAK